ncbi:MAG: hypothetical protein QNJ72_04400 [Pleurocapsa sp. MO_226.B13]|nr:hypothetical protein [Pleurocapsa sp. MO_226.B13]
MKRWKGLAQCDRTELVGLDPGAVRAIFQDSDRTYNASFQGSEREK